MKTTLLLLILSASRALADDTMIYDYEKNLRICIHRFGPKYKEKADEMQKQYDSIYQYEDAYKNDPVKKKEYFLKLEKAYNECLEFQKVNY